MKVSGQISKFTDAFRAKVRHFGRDEDGSMIVFTLFLLVLMLIVSGMAVDFMRFESRRAHLQGLVDRAVLAAADLDQTADPADVVIDYFDKAGMLEQLKGQPIVTPGTDYREVTANGELVLDTFFLKLIGMDQLTASASSTAIEGVGDIEISLVLDISGSMRYELRNDDGTTPTMVDPDTGATRNVTRMDRLQEASTNFVNTLLTPATADRISLSLVSYTEQVNVGPDIFGQLNTNSMHDFSHCVEFDAAAFETTTLNLGQSYDQAQHYQYNSAYDSSGTIIQEVNNPICPFRDFEQIVPLNQNAGYLTGIIDQLEPRAGTSIYLGLKWGATLLDPSIRPVIAALPAGQVDTVFGARPADYPGPDTTGDTRKYIVLMTDGQNSNSNRLNANRYDSPSEVAHWAQENLNHFLRTDNGGGSYSSWTHNVQTPALGDQYMASMCDEVRDRGIILFAISLGSSNDAVSDQHGWDQMEACATTTNLFYKTNGEELVEIFEDIAEQITDLRLTQ